MKTLPLAKIISHVFLAVLVLNISVVLPRTTWMCQCDQDLKAVSACCNCPQCVEKRDGLLSYCGFSNLKDKEEAPILKMAGCQCGPGLTVLNLPVNNPFLPIEGADYSLHLPEYSFITEINVPPLEQSVIPDDRPG